MAAAVSEKRIRITAREEGSNAVIWKWDGLGLKEPLPQDEESLHYTRRAIDWRRNTLRQRPTRNSP